MKSTTLRRIAAVSAGATLTLTGLTALAGTPAHADTSPSGTAAVDWLSSQLENGVLGGNCAFYCGPSIDAAVSAAALGDLSVANAVNAAVAADPEAYSDYAYEYAGDDYAGRASGSVAKELVLAQLVGADPRNYGAEDVDLVTRLEELVQANGRTADLATKNGSPDPFGDYANTFGQSFAVQGLVAAGSPEAGAATQYLLAQQCPAGYFRQSFAPKAADTPCTADTPAPGADATGLAVLGLQSQLSNPAVRAAVDRAVAWLAAAQAADGSFSNAEGQQNSNSTGLAGWALGVSCRTAAADRAAAFVRTLQVPTAQTGALAAEKGAVAFTADRLAASQGSGITSGDRSSWWFATAQAAAVLAWDPAAPATVRVAGPERFVKGGKVARFTITGAAAGERVCVTDSRGRTVALTGTGSPLTHEVATREKQNGLVTVSATTGPGRASDQVEVLGDERLRPRFRDTVEQGDRAAVKVKSLGAREKVKVLVDGERVLKGRANRKGVFRSSLIARFAPGRHRLVVVGQFKDRSGATAFRVVR